jgi:hypothetical protein
VAQQHPTTGFRLPDPKNGNAALPAPRLTALDVIDFCRERSNGGGRAGASLTHRRYELAVRRVARPRVFHQPRS